MFFGEIAALAKAQVFLGINPFHFGEEVLDFGNNRLVRTVVQNNNLRIDSLACVTNGLEAGRDKVARVIRNDDD